jgi:hypothetical protein
MFAGHCSVAGPIHGVPSVFEPPLTPPNMPPFPASAPAETSGAEEVVLRGD